MANLSLFRSLRGRLLPRPDTVNEAGGQAYQLSPAGALAQYVMTGCLHGTFYATAEAQLDQVLKLAAEVEASFLAKLAVYARREGGMKDMPALLCAILTTRSPMFFEKAAPLALDNARMVRTFVQIMRSGAVGRKSLGTAPKRFVQEWLYRQSDEALFRGAVGTNPSLADLIKMVHPRPANERRKALYGYLLGRNYDAAQLPALVAAYEAFKHDRAAPMPDVPFQYLASLDLAPAQWKAIAENAPWQMTRMNLNTFARHGVFSDRRLVKLVAKRLGDPALVRQARAFPYQLMMAYAQVGDGVPSKIRNALQDALEVATENVPSVLGQVVVCPDVSGSMHSSVTGVRRGATSKVRCVDVAALVAAALVRKNPDARVLPFSDNVVKARLNPRDSVMTNAQKLAALPAGGTNCGAPLRQLNAERAKVDLVVFVSDNQSWMDSRYAYGATATMAEWETLRQRHPSARLVCLDLQPYGSVQAKPREDILHVGGFSDAVFTVVGDFARGELRGDHWVRRIESVEF